MPHDRPSVHDEWTEDLRYRVSNKEAVITAGFFLAYIVLTIGTAWLIGGNRDIDEIHFVLGFPDWLFWSTFVLGSLFCVVPYLLVKRFFTDMPLDADSDWTDERPAPAHRSREET